MMSLICGLTVLGGGYVAAESTDSSASAARHLAAAHKGATYVSGAVVRIGGHELTLHVALENAAERAGKSFVGLVVTSAIDGHPADALKSGSVGVGDSREDATRAAIDEWVVQYGMPIAAALDPSVAEKGTRVGGYIAQIGPTGIRAAAPGDAGKKLSGPELHRAFLRRLEPELPRLFPPADGQLHALTLTLLLKPDAATEGSCRVDGQESAALCDLARSFAWPTPATPIMLKQFYVLSAARMRRK